MGAVKWFNDDKGFGFIGPDGGGPDVFVHFTNIHGAGHRSLPAGARVAFEVQESRKKKGKMEAVDVRVVEENKEAAPAPKAKSASKGGSTSTSRSSKPGARVNGSPPH